MRTPTRTSRRSAAGVASSGPSEAPVRKPRLLHPLFLLVLCAIAASCGAGGGTGAEEAPRPASSESAPAQPPTAAREGGSSAATARPEGSPPPSPGDPGPTDFVLEADGTVIEDGDAISECHSFAEARRQGVHPPGLDRELARRVEEGCERAGFSRSNRGDMVGGNSEAIVGTWR